MEKLASCLHIISKTPTNFCCLVICDGNMQLYAALFQPIVKNKKISTETNLGMLEQEKNKIPKC